MGLVMRPRDPGFEARVRASFERQAFMALIGARLGRVEAGHVEIVMPYRPDLTQQAGYFHAGATSAIADSSAGYAAYSLFDADTDVLTTEFKINLLNPAAGDRLIAPGRVVKPGRTLTVAASDVYAVTGANEVHVATALLTMIQVRHAKV